MTEHLTGRRGYRIALSGPPWRRRQIIVLQVEVEYLINGVPQRGKVWRDATPLDLIGNTTFTIK